MLYYANKKIYGLANFSKTIFFKEANFTEATFSAKASFYETIFSKTIFIYSRFAAEAYFLYTAFNGDALFNFTIFEQPSKAVFDSQDLFKVSFANSDSDITRIRFGDAVTWGGEDGFTITEENWLLKETEGEAIPFPVPVSLELVLSVYRNLRENYEFRLRYDDASKFFIKEMGLKRKYRNVRSTTGQDHKTASFRSQKELLV